MQGYFRKWHHLQGYPRADGRHPRFPTLPFPWALTTVHAMRTCTSMQTCVGLDTVRLPIPHPGMLLGAAPALGSLAGSIKGTKGPRLLHRTDFESRKPVCPAFPSSQLLNRWVSIPLAVSGSADTSPVGPGSGGTGCLLCWRNLKPWGKSGQAR